MDTIKVKAIGPLRAYQRARDGTDCARRDDGSRTSSRSSRGRTQPANESVRPGRAYIVRAWGQGPAPPPSTHAVTAGTALVWTRTEAEERGGDTPSRVGAVKWGERPPRSDALPRCTRLEGRELMGVEIRLIAPCAPVTDPESGSTVATDRPVGASVDGLPSRNQSLRRPPGCIGPFVSRPRGAMALAGPPVDLPANVGGTFRGSHHTVGTELPG